MNDWISLNLEFDMKITDEIIHIRKLNFNSAKYSYMRIHRNTFSIIWKELKEFESRNGILTERTRDGS